MSARRGLFLVGFLLHGCVIDRGRYEQRQREICDPVVGCGVERPWWPDEDGDGWGDGAREPEWSVSAPTGRVDNRQDCDDEAFWPTGDLGLCPHQFGEADRIRVGSAESRQIEWVAVELRTPLYLDEADDRCGAWGGGEGWLGAAPDEVADIEPVWVASALPVPDAWAASPVGDPLVDGALLWDGSLLRNAEPFERAHVACRRDTPDPDDHRSYEGLD
jgi:hypothetical protein